LPCTIYTFGTSITLIKINNNYVRLVYIVV